MKTKSLNIIFALGLIPFVAGYAQSWKQTRPSPIYGTYGGIGMSADGKTIYAVGNLVSTNSGTTWVLKSNISSWGGAPLGGIAVVADGSRVYASMENAAAPRSRVLVGTNQWAQWAYTFPETISPPFQRVACSADGTKVIDALPQSAILYSTNGGANCYTSSVSPADWTSVASSADGARMVAAANGGSIYFSEDFGANWTPANLPADAWNCVCTSADGKWIGATSTNHSYISSDAGASWRTNDFAGLAIACSANGSVWLITSTQVETSTDGGRTWQPNLGSDQWNGAAVSADGNLMAVLGTQQGIWIGRFTASPQLNIQPQDSNIALSWIVPSTNFVLQQSADLLNSSWTPVATSPALNFTNLNEQVSVPATGSNVFFRLATQ